MLRASPFETEVTHRLKSDLESHLTMTSQLIGRMELEQWFDEQEMEQKHGYIACSAPPGWGKSAFISNRINSKCKKNISTIYWFVKPSDTVAYVFAAVIYQLKEKYKQYGLPLSEEHSTGTQDNLKNALHAVSNIIRERSLPNPEIIYLESIHEARSDEGISDHFKTMLPGNPDIPPINLNGELRRQLLQALMSAFPTVNSLKIMVQTGLEENLEVITGGANLREVVFDLIQWAETHNKLEELIEKARQENPGNQDLYRFAVQQLGIETINVQDTIERHTHQFKASDVHPLIGLLPIPADLPANVLIVLTARENIDGLNASKPDSNELLSWQRQAIRQYIQEINQSRGLDLSIERIDQLVEKSNGCFAMAKHILNKNQRALLKRFKNEPDSISKSFDEYLLETVWPNACIIADKRDLPPSVLATLLHIMSVMWPYSRKPLTLKDLKNIVGFAVDKYHDQRIGAISVKAYRPKEDDTGKSTWELVDKAWPIIRGFMEPVLSESSVRHDNYRIFHDRFFEVLPEFRKMNSSERILEEEEITLCHQFVADFYDRQLIEEIDQDTAQEMAYAVENENFITRLGDWLLALQRVKHKNRCVAPIGWYLYGHYWWDELTGDFSFCTDLLMLVEDFLSRYKDEELDTMLKGLQLFREAWHPKDIEGWHGNSIWKLSHLSCKDQIERDTEQWAKVEDACNELLAFVKSQRSKTNESAIVHLTRPGSDKDEPNHRYRRYQNLMVDILSRCGIDKGQIALSDPRPAEVGNMTIALLQLFCADSLHGQGDHQTAIKWYIQSLWNMCEQKMLYWCPEYLLVDLADCYLYTGRSDLALQTIADALQIVDIWRGTDDEDNSSEAECFRVLGDIFWEREQYDVAVDAYRASQFLAFWAHNDMKKADSYTIAFQQEMDWNLIDRMIELYGILPDMALHSCQECSAFWRQYMGRVGISQNLPSADVLRQLCEKSDVKAMQKILLPPPPPIDERIQRKETRIDEIIERRKSLLTMIGLDRTHSL